MSTLPITALWAGPTPTAYPARQVITIATPGADGPNEITDETTTDFTTGYMYAAYDGNVVPVVLNSSMSLIGVNGGFPPEFDYYDLGVNIAGIASGLGLGTLAYVTPSGTPDGTKFLRDDFSWQNVAGSGGISIGDTVTLGEPGRVLFVGDGPILSQNAGLTYDPATDTLAAGTYTSTGGQNLSEKFGAESTVSNTETTVIGNGASSAGRLAVVVGYGASANSSAQQSVCVGAQSTVNAIKAIAVGAATTVSTDSCIAVGADITIGANRQRSIVLGGAVSPGFSDNIAIGNGGGDMSFDEIGQTLLGSRSAISGTGHRVTVFGVSNTTGSKLYDLAGSWIDSTHATRTSRLALSAYYTSTRQEGVRIDGDSGGVKLGFFGGSATAKPTITGSRGGNAAIASLLTALAGLGLLTDSTSA